MAAKPSLAESRFGGKPSSIGPASGEKRFARWKVRVAAAIIVAAGVLAYGNSFHGPFVFDDETSIPKNPFIRRVWPIWKAMSAPPQQTVAGRPVLSLSLALNYAVCGLDVRGYHAGNLAVHILCALVLFGIVRRTLLTERLRKHFGRASWILGLICASIWVVHPLQTSSVTYIIQRAESLMGLFHLLTLYCAVRAFTSPRPYRWYVLAVASCASGMGTKEVMAISPLLVLLYDRAFVSRCFKELFHRRWGFYLALGGTWAILGALVGSTPRSESVGFGFDITVLDYAATQCNVIILYYLKLSFWPHPLVLDYGWPLAERFSDFAPTGLALAILLLATLAGLRYRPPWGFLGAWFFLILGPSSSFLPIASEIAAEHRMYLPLAAVVVGVVIAGYSLGRRLPVSRAVSTLLGYTLAAAIVLTFGLLTARRNLDYRSKVSIWEDTVDKRPDNHRAHTNLGVAYSEKKQWNRAIERYEKALELKPNDSHAYYNRGIAYQSKGESDLAIRDFDMAIKLNPEYTLAYIGRAVAHESKGHRDKAIRDCTKAIELDPNVPSNYNNRGIAYANRGEYDRAILDYDKAIELDPDFAAGYNNRGNALGHMGKDEEAIVDYTKAIELDPGYVSAYSNRGISHGRMGNWDQAIADFTTVIRLDPNSSSAYTSRGINQGKKGDWEAAIRDYDKAIQLDPNYALPYNNRGIAFTREHKWDRAIRDYDRAIQLDPNFVTAFKNRGFAYKNKRQFDRAIRDYDAAVGLNPTDASTYNSRGITFGQKGDYARAIHNFDKAIELDPAYGSAYNNRALARGHTGEHDRALQDFTRAIEVNPRDAAAYNNRGGVYEYMGNQQRAESDYRKAIELNPSYALGHKNLAGVLMRKGDAREAVRHYRRALRVRRDWPEVLRDLGWILSTHDDPQLRDGPEALRLARRDCELTGNRLCEALDVLAAAYAETEQFAKAVETARRAHKIALAAEKKDRAEEIRGRLELYGADRPYRQSSASQPPVTGK